jgi:hypothetical protein
MAWISLIFILSLQAAELPLFLTKHSHDSLRFVSQDGSFNYLQKKPGLLALISNFKSYDVISENSKNEYRVMGTPDKRRLIIESIPNSHSLMNLGINHDIFVVDFGNIKIRKVGSGRNPKLHIKDDWISYYDLERGVIKVQSLITDKFFEIKLMNKQNPFQIPNLEMISNQVIVFSDINESGYAALLSFDLITNKRTILYKSQKIGTKIELCKSNQYLGVGEFSHDGVSNGSKIQIAKIEAYPELSGFSIIYESQDPDIGSMICKNDSIYFIKTTTYDANINHKITEAVKIELENKKIEIKTNLKNVTQIIDMDGRIMIPFRGELFVIEGNFDLSEDKLKTFPQREEPENVI